MEFFSLAIDSELCGGVAAQASAAVRKRLRGGTAIDDSDIREFRAVSDTAISVLLDRVEKMLPNFDDQQLLAGLLVWQHHDDWNDRVKRHLNRDGIRLLIEYVAASDRRQRWPERTNRPLHIDNWSGLGIGIMALRLVIDLCRQKLSSGRLQVRNNTIIVTAETIDEFDIVSYIGAMKRLAPDHLLMDDNIRESANRPRSFDAVDAALEASELGGLTIFMSVVKALISFAEEAPRRRQVSPSPPLFELGPWPLPEIIEHVCRQHESNDAAPAIAWVDRLTLRPQASTDWLSVLERWAQPIDRKRRSSVQFQPLVAYDGNRVMVHRPTLETACYDWLELLIEGQWPLGEPPAPFSNAAAAITQERQNSAHRDDLWDALGFDGMEGFPGPVRVPSTDLVAVASLDMGKAMRFGIDLATKDGNGIVPGEIDLLVFDSGRNVLWVGEVKDPARVHSPYDMHSDLVDFEFTARTKAYSSKLEAKISAVRRAGVFDVASGVAQCVGLSCDPAEPVETRGVFISRDITVFAFHERSTWFHSSLRSLRRLLDDCPGLSARPWRQAGWWFEDPDRIDMLPKAQQLAVLARVYDGLPPRQ